MDNQNTRLLVVLVVVLTIVATASITALVSGKGGAGGVNEAAVKTIVLDMFRKEPDVVMAAFEEGRSVAVQKAQAEATQKLGERKKDLEDPSFNVVGNASGDVTVVEFFDYNCGFCHKVYPSVTRLLKDDPKVKVVLINTPILGQMSVEMAKAEIAFGRIKKDKVFDFHSALMANTPRNEEQIFAIADQFGVGRAELKVEMEKAETQKTIDKAMQLAQDIGVRGTPAFVIGGAFSPGAIEYDEMKDQVLAARTKK